MANIDLNAIVRDLGQLSQVQAAQTQEIAQTRFSQGEVGEQIARNLFEVAERSERVEMQKLEAQLEAQNNSRAAARAAGMDMTASNEIISHISEGLRTDMLAFQAASRHAQEIEANGNLLANPVGWLNAVLNGPEAQANRELTAQRLQRTQAQLNNMHSLTQSNVQTQNAIAETMTQASIKDTARANALLAESKALEAVNQAKEYTVAGWEVLRDQGSVEFNRRLQVGNTVRAAQYQAENIRMRKEEFKQRKAALDMEMESKQSFQYLADMANAAAKELGLKRKPITAGEMERHWGQNTQYSQGLMELADVGLMSQNAGSKVIAMSPAEADSRLRRFGSTAPMNLDDAATRAMETAPDKLREEIEAASAFLTKQNTEHGLNMDNYDDPVAQMTAFNSIVDEYVREADKNFGQYKLNTSAIEATYPELTKSNYYDKVVTPLASTDSGLTIQDAAAQTAERFANEEVDINEAAEGLQALWKAQRDLFAATNGRDALGINTYTAEVEPSLLVGKKYVPESTGRMGITMFDPSRGRNVKTNEIYERVDLTDPNAVTRYLINYRSNKLARQMQENANR